MYDESSCGGPPRRSVITLATTRHTKSPARKALPSWLQHQEEQPHDALVEGIVLDLPWVKGGDGKVVARELARPGPAQGRAGEARGVGARRLLRGAQAPAWRRPPRSHRPHGLKWWDVVSAALTVAALAAHAVGAYHNQPLTALGVAWRLPAALALVDLLTGLTHGLFDGQPWLVPYGLRFGAGRGGAAARAPRHGDDLLLLQLRAPLRPAPRHARRARRDPRRLPPLRRREDWFFLLLATAIGSCTQVIHKHSHLRGHVDGHYGDSKRPKARVDAVAKAIFFLQDLRILMPHETHRIHHAKGDRASPRGWCNWLINPLVIQDDAYDEIPTLRLDQPIYDIPEVEQTRGPPRRDVWRWAASAASEPHMRAGA